MSETKGIGFGFGFHVNVAGHLLSVPGPFKMDDPFGHWRKFLSWVLAGYDGEIVACYFILSSGMICFEYAFTY